MANKFSGIFTAIISPFTEKGELDEKAMASVADYQIRAGVNGLYACGSTGEGVSMTVAQRKKVAEICVAQSNGKVPVITQVGDEAIENIRELALHAKDIGADGIAALTPYYYKPDEEGVLSYYMEIGSFTDLPLFIYHIPPLTGLTLSAKTITRIMNDVPTVKGIKDSSGNFTHLLELLYLKPRDVTVFSGSDEYALAGLISGIDGCVTGYASAFPELYVKLYSLFREGKTEEGKQLQEKISMIRALLKTPPIQPIKEAAKFRGISGGYVKKPLRRMTDAEVKALRAQLQNIHAI